MLHWNIETKYKWIALIILVVQFINRNCYDHRYNNKAMELIHGFIKGASKYIEKPETIGNPDKQGLVLTIP